MAEVAYTLNQISATAFEVTFTSLLSDPWFYVYRNGVFWQRTQDTTIIVDVQAGERIRIEVFDDENDSPSPYYPDRVILAFYPEGNTLEYKIEQRKSGEAYAEAANSPLRTFEEEYVCWQSELLDDVSTYEFRVTPRLINGDYGTAKEVSMFMVRVPDEPAQDFSFDNDTQRITINSV